MENHPTIEDLARMINKGLKATATKEEVQALDKKVQALDKKVTKESMEKLGIEIALR